jgi:hypothetical protein
LFEKAVASAHKEIAIVRTGLHADDMLTDRSSPEFRAVLSLTYEWVSHSSDPLRQIDSVWTEPQFYHAALSTPSEVSRLDYPSYFRAASGLWNTSVEFVPTPITIDATAYGTTDRVSVASSLLVRTGFHLSDDFGIQLGMTHAKANTEAVAALCYSVGSLVRLRRLSFVHGFVGQERNIVSLDAAFTLLDFQLSYGSFDGRNASGDLSVELPIVAKGDGSYGILAGVGQGIGEDRIHGLTARIMAMSGPRIDLLNARLRLSAGVEWCDKRLPAYLVGLSLYPGEF